MGEREMWVGRVSALLPPPPPTAATTSIAHLPILLPAPLTFPPKTPADSLFTPTTHSCASATSPSSVHSSVGSSCNGGNPDPLSPFLSCRRGRGGFPLACASSRRRSGGFPPGFLYVDGDEVYDEWEGGEDGFEEGAGPAVPFEDMRLWLRNKPAGFGEGKSYDTAIEDRLMEEMEQSRKAQLANVRKLKSGAVGQAGTKNGDPGRVDATEVVPGGACVRVRGLPRKKNIHKDLKLAFKGFPNIVNISPAVVGNKKTRDPVCKGFAFVDFDSDEAAIKFVQMYSKQSVAFGRVQKDITCDLINTFHSYNPGSEEFGQHPTFAQQQLTDIEGGPSTETDLVDFTQDLEESNSEVLNMIAKCHGTELNDKEIMMEDEYSSLQLVDATIDVGYSLKNIPISEESSGLRSGEEAPDLMSSRQKQKAQLLSRKKSTKTKSNKAPKLSMPPSVARLKVKERAVLTGVLSKYGEQTVPAS